MPYDISQFSPAYGGTINSSGNVVNVADLIDETTGLMKPGSMKAMTFQTGATAIGNGTANDVSGYATLSIDVVISGTATVSFEVSNDNTNYFAIAFTITSSSSTNTVVSATNRGLRFNVSAFKWFRARISAYTSGTVDVTGYASTAQFYQMLNTTTYGNTDSNSATTAMSPVGAYNLMYSTGGAWARQRDVSNITDAWSGGGLATSGLMAYNGTTWDRIRTVAGLGDGLSSTVAGLPSTALHGYNGTGYDRIRIGKTYKWNEYLGLTAGSTFTVWTPTSTKKIRIMGLSVSVSAACALNVRVGTAGSGTRIATFRFAGAGNYYMDFGNGYLATNATTDVLEINNPSASPTSATTDVHVAVWGTEE